MEAGILRLFQLSHNTLFPVVVVYFKPPNKIRLAVRRVSVLADDRHGRNGLVDPGNQRSSLIRLRGVVLNASLQTKRVVHSSPFGECCDRSPPTSRRLTVPVPRTGSP